MSKLKVCIIGTGQESCNSHLPNFLKNSDSAVVSAVCDINGESAKNAAERFGIPAWYASHQEMLEREKPDLVSICVTNKFHESITIDALRAGCHVFCEKPPALHEDGARRMEQEAEKAGKLLTYNLHYRFAPEVQAVRSMIQTGDFGKLYAGRVRAFRRRGIPGWGTFTNKELQGGGAMMDIGIHMLDTALYLLDYPKPTYAAANYSNLIGRRKGVGLMGDWDPEKFTVEDSMFGYLQFQNGLSLQLETAFALNCKQEKCMNVELFGDLSGASVFDREIYTERSGALLDARLPFLKETNNRLASISSFIRCCAEHETPLVTASQGTQLMKIVGALYRSAETGKPVEL